MLTTQLLQFCSLTNTGLAQSLAGELHLISSTYTIFKGTTKMQVTFPRCEALDSWQTRSSKICWHNKWCWCTVCRNYCNNISGNSNVHVKLYSLPPANGRRTKIVALIPVRIWTKMCEIAYRKWKSFKFIYQLINKCHFQSFSRSVLDKTKDINKQKDILKNLHQFHTGN